MNTVAVKKFLTREKVLQQPTGILADRDTVNRAEEFEFVSVLEVVVVLHSHGGRQTV